jgi:hypothetical protein
MNRQIELDEDRYDCTLCDKSYASHVKYMQHLHKGMQAEQKLHPGAITLSRSVYIPAPGIVDLRRRRRLDSYNLARYGHSASRRVEHMRVYRYYTLYQGKIVQSDRRVAPWPEGRR